MDTTTTDTTTNGRAVWAAFIGTASAEGITLHWTERDALRSVVVGLSLTPRDLFVLAKRAHVRVPRGATTIDVETVDTDDLREVLDEAVRDRADDYTVVEVDLPR